MSYRVVMRPDKNLGVFNDNADTWVDQSLGDGDAADLLSDAEDIDPAEAAKMIGQLRAGRLGKEYDGYVMTWAEAEWRTGGRHGNRPLERDAKGMRLLTHGTGGWRRGCRCGVCTEAHLGDNRERYGTAADRNLTHSLSGYARGCRCPVCTDARAAYGRTHRAQKAGTSVPPPRPQGGDKMTETLDTRYTGHETALIGRLAAQDGVTLSQWVRDPILAILAERGGYTAPARRTEAPRTGTPSPADRAGGARDKRPHPRYTPREKALIEQLAAEDGVPVGQWLREPVLAILETRAGYVDTVRRRAPRRPNYKQRQAETVGQQQ